jgi:hypothetical protein
MEIVFSTSGGFYCGDRGENVPLLFLIVSSSPVSLCQEKPTVAATLSLPKRQSKSVVHPFSLFTIP